MKDIFGKYKTLKDGTEGKTIVYPTVFEMHTNQEFIEKWVDYSTLDAEVTFYLYFTLRRLLKQLAIDYEGMKNMFDLYEKYWLPFG